MQFLRSGTWGLQKGEFGPMRDVFSLGLLKERAGRFCQFQVLAEVLFCGFIKPVSFIVLSASIVRAADPSQLQLSGRWTLGRGSKSVGTGPR